VRARLRGLLAAFRGPSVSRRPWSVLSIALTFAAVVTVIGIIVIANRMLAVAFGAAAFAMTALWLSERRRSR